MADTRLFKMKLFKKCFDNRFTKNHTKFYLTLKKVLKSTFFKPWPAGNQTSKSFFFYKVNKHIPVLDIAKNKSGSYLWHSRNSTLKKVQCDRSFIRNNAM